MPIKTWIRELDTLLFGDDGPQGGAEDKKRGFAPGDVLLIRGEPGSGKTTLALQIAVNVLRNDQRLAISYCSLEEPTGWLPRRMPVPPVGDFRHASRQQFEEALKAWCDAKEAPRKMAKRVARTVKDVVPENLAVPVLTYVFQALFGNTGKNVRSFGPGLFVIDSLGALMNILMHAFPTMPARLLFNDFCRYLRNPQQLKDETEMAQAAPVIIIIGEHHFVGRDMDKFFPESYFCDVEIVLRPEPVRAPRESTGDDKIALGYNLTAIADPAAKHTETRSFCRVVKSRYSRNQSRRCAYDIEQGAVRFFETYPGDGKLMLFAENDQQKAAWNSFFQRDLVDAYPALRYETFTMAGLDTVYESSRRLLQMPLKTDMLLSSLDSYWVLGYRDYRLKTLIHQNLCRIMLRGREDLGADVEGRSPASAWACIQYPRLVNDLVHYAMCRLDATLYEKTKAELAKLPTPTRTRRREAAEGRISALDKMLVERTNESSRLAKEIPARYEWLCKYLFNKTSAEVFEGKDVMPRPDLRETFLRPLPRSRIMLFGQYNTGLVPFLAREDMHQYDKSEDHWLCVPYDANIGVFVVRADVAKRLSTEQHALRYREAFRTLKLREVAALEATRAYLHKLLDRPTRAQYQEVRAQIDAAVAMATKSIDSDLSRLPDPGDVSGADRLSWDQVLCLSAAADLPLGIETTNFDTLMATFLELVWNCGGKLEVNARYEIPGLHGQVVPLVRALHYFRGMFAVARTPRYQTIDPAKFMRAVEKSEPYGKWLFGRFWYSTLVDALTAVRPGAEGAASDFIWKQTDEAGDGRPMELEIIQMPAGQPGVSHYTCSGEWSFALLAGSENVSLACDLISNLMGSLKVTERGLHGACLPTVNIFYRRYAGERCIPPPIRPDLEVPKMTFGDLGKKYMGVDTPTGDSGPRAIFRQSIYDYRHCAREIFGELLAVRNAPVEQSMEAEAKLILTAAIRMLKGIQELGGRYIFIRDFLREDVKTIAQESADGREEWVNPKKRPRQVRIAAPPGASARLNDADVNLVDLSLTGCCLRDGTSRTKGRPVTVDVGGETLTGKVARSNAQITGVAFDTNVTESRFGKILSALG